MHIHVVEGKHNSGKSTLIANLSSVKRGFSICRVTFNDEEKKNMLTLNTSTNEGKIPKNGAPSPTSFMWPEEFINYAKKMDRHIDGILVPLITNKTKNTPDGRVCAVADDYLRAFEAKNWNRCGHVQPKTADFSIPGTDQTLALQGALSNPPDPPEDLPRKVREHWEWRGAIKLH